MNAIEKIFKRLQCNLNYQYHLREGITIFKEELIKLNELLENNWSSIYNEETTSSMTILQKRKILNFIEEIKSLEEIAKSLGTWLDGFEDFMENFSIKNN